MISIQRFLKNFLIPYGANKSRTIRYAFPMLFVVAAFLGAAVIDSTAGSYIHIESSKTKVAAGEIFSIDVYVYADMPVNAVDISLAFPSNQVEITGIDTGRSVITLWTTEPYVENNTILLQGGTFRRGFKGDYLIATVNAKAKTSGLATFEVANVLLLAGDGTGSEVMTSGKSKKTAQLFVANKDGSFSNKLETSTIEGDVNIRIVTDIDGDGKVSLADVSRFMMAWTAKTEVFDFSGDGRMTFRDFGIILADVFFK